MNRFYKNIIWIVVFILCTWLLDTAIDFVNSPSDLGFIVGTVLFSIALFLLFIVIRSVVYNVINLFKK